VENEILPVTVPRGIGLVVWSPLAQGMLTGKYDGGIPKGSRFAKLEQTAEQFITEQNQRKVMALKSVADTLGITRAQLALAWVLRQPGVSSVITGATKVGQVQDNLKAADVDLDEKAVEIEAILSN
jgi:aryl-alcohol dehydrogenase-like predicted oxidoreductase